MNATIEVYERISKELLPTPARFGGFSGRGEGAEEEICKATNATLTANKSVPKLY